jgi:hypothetical protein
MAFFGISSMELIMQAHVRAGLIAFVLLSATGGFAAAQTTSPVSKSEQSQDLKPLNLTPTQKEAIFTAVRRSSLSITKPPSSLSVAIGAQVPASTQIDTLPDAVVADLPELRSFRFTIVNNTLLLIDPTLMRVVEIIR